MSELDIDRVSEWVRYCKSTGKDVRVAVVLPHSVDVTVAERQQLRQLGAGLYFSTGTGLTDDIPPRDLGLVVELPDRASMSRKVRQLLGPIYEQFDRSNWQGGFGDACTVLEQQARRHLNEGVAKGRITFTSSGGKPVTFKPGAIDKMTMGGLVDAFAMISTPNKIDSAIGEILALLNKDRVGEAHHKGKAATEARLRKNVGTHMWAIAEGLKLLCA
jgi:hypothetical protein